jgi:hypothetical protein
MGSSQTISEQPTKFYIFILEFLLFVYLLIVYIFFKEIV